MELSGLSLEASFRLLVRELGVRVGVCLLAVGLCLLERLLAEKQIFHNKIVGNPVVVGAVSTMKKIDPCTLWWVVQWGNEYLTRFKVSADVEQVGALESYKTWTQKEKAKLRLVLSTSPRSLRVSLLLRRRLFLVLPSLLTLIRV